MADMENDERVGPLKGGHEPDGLPEVETGPDHETGFLFCPRCGHVVLGFGVNSRCPQCGHRFCPSCSD